MEFQSSSGPRRQSDQLFQTSSSRGYIPQPAIQGSEYTTDRMYSLKSTISNHEQDPLLDLNHSIEAIHREALQRHLEKQQIREEIIRAENKRRQMLEAEVRRELMMEQQMLMQHHGYATEERPLDGYSSDYRPVELVDGKFPFVERVDSWATKDPWAFSGSSADKFSFVDRVDGQPSKEPWTYSGSAAERFSFVNCSDYNRPVATEEQRKVPNHSARNEVPSYNPTQPYYSESMMPKVNSAIRESQPYNYMQPEVSLAPNVLRMRPEVSLAPNDLRMRPEVSLAPNDLRMRPEVYLAHKDLRPYMRPEVISAPTSSDPYMQPYAFSSSAPNVPGTYAKAMHVQINSAANELRQDISNKYASGMKRKATDQPKRTSNNIYKKNKSDGGWSCTLCQISVSSEKTLDDHFHGRRHKENEEQSRDKKKLKNESEHQKGKTVVKEESLNLTKPQDISNKYASGMKRKATDQPKRTSNNTYKKNKSDGGWSCTLCQISVSSEKTLDDHFHGRRHKENEEQSRAKKKFKNETEHPKGKTVVKEESLNLTKPQVSDDIKKIDAAKNKDSPQSEKPRKFFKFWCKLCQVGADSNVTMKAHNKGKSHFLNLQEKGEVGVSASAT